MADTTDHDSEATDPTADAVDTFVQDMMRPELQALVARLRALMHEAAPHATEQISYGLPMWKAHGYLAWISPTQQAITFGFTYGAYFTDPYGLLTGRGKHARHVKLKSAADAEHPVLRDYIRQAVERDSR